MPPGPHPCRDRLLHFPVEPCEIRAVEGHDIQPVIADGPSRQVLGCEVGDGKGLLIQPPQRGAFAAHPDEDRLPYLRIGVRQGRQGGWGPVANYPAGAAVADP